jgi:hypothetical protein
VKRLIKIIFVAITLLIIETSRLPAKTILSQGTAVDIVFPYTVDGGSLREGAAIVVEIAQDFKQSGKTIFKSGERGTVLVDKSEGRQLILGGGTLKTVTGEQVKISVNKQAKGKGVTKNASFWIGLLLFWPALFFIRTKDAIIPAGSLTQAFIIQDTELVGI